MAYAPDVGGDVGRDEVRGHVVGDEYITRLACAVRRRPLHEELVGLGGGQVLHALLLQLLEELGVLLEVRRERDVRARMADELARHGFRHVAEQDAHEHVEVVNGAYERAQRANSLVASAKQW